MDHREQTGASCEVHMRIHDPRERPYGCALPSVEAFILLQGTCATLGVERGLCAHERDWTASNDSPR